MTTQTVDTPSAEDRLAAIESRMAALEAVMTLFIEEQREYRREVNARFDRIDEEQREYRREVNSRFDRVEDRINRVEDRINRVEDRIDRVGAGITRMNYTVLGIVGALAIAVIVASVFS